MNPADSIFPDYIGRFAPSPTGPVHFGTLLAALGSYLQARSQHGQWLVRMEDVDITRSIEGADAEILRSLEAFGLEWDGDVVYQSRRTDYYRQALDQLQTDGLLFPCLCSRKQIARVAGEAAGTSSAIYPGTCRQRCFPETSQHAIRVKVDDSVIRFHDNVVGEQQQALQQQCGDFVIRRRDGLFAYQLAVVVDDALQGITEVVRGADLLDSTPRQIYLQQLLGYPIPSYCHLPLAVDGHGAKISKSTGAARVDSGQRQQALVRILDRLGQKPPAELVDNRVEDILDWGIDNWRLQQVPVGTFTLAEQA